MKLRVFIMKAKIFKQHQIPDWFKSRGYLHITPQIDASLVNHKLISQITNEEYISKYAFFPLIYSQVKERRYKFGKEKRDSRYLLKRSHSYSSNGETIRNTKIRPLHYATHKDALIFGYYSHDLQNRYEKVLSSNPELSKCIIAYRKIPINGDTKRRNKSTIHFAKEVFDEISKRANIGTCVVLAFDIKSFFSNLNHQKLKKSWANLLCVNSLPLDHYKVFKASTAFTYILLDDLRLQKNKNGVKMGFDEKKLAKIRNKFGFNAFFESTEEFRNKIKNRELKLHRFPFRNKESNRPVGIPQGLPISAMLANLYLLDFDKNIYQNICEKLGGFYRRYSDDMVIVCSENQKEKVKSIILEEIEKNYLSISTDKTEEFIFRKIKLGKQPEKIVSIKLSSNKCTIESPFTYLGFEYYGNKTLIKSANLTKFYRRMIDQVRRKCRRAVKLAERNGGKPVIYKKSLFKLYSNINISKRKIINRRSILEMTEFGDYRIKSVPSNRKLKSNYFSYIKRASSIMEDYSILNQLKKHRVIFHKAMSLHLKKYIRISKL